MSFKPSEFGNPIMDDLKDAITGDAVEPVKEVLRLTQDQLAVLERKLVPPTVTNSTTELMAGFQLGVQAALKELRDGFTIGRR